MSIWAAALLFIAFVAISAHIRYRVRAQAGVRLVWLVSFSFLAASALFYILASFHFVASVK